MRRFHQINGKDIEAFSLALSSERVLFGDAVSEDYARDEMTEYGSRAPGAVLKCESAEEVSAVLSYCSENGIAVTPRGAGTGLCGGCVPIKGGAVLSTERMNNILEIDRENMTATVEPGVLLMEFAKVLEGTGLFYPPDPGEKSATLGGNAMTNAGGMRAVRYGVTRDYILGMQVVLPSGEIIELGGKCVKNSSGYSLLNLMIGSEGTLGVVTRLTLKLIPEPKENLTVLAPFENLAAAASAVNPVLACGCEPTAVEFMEREVIEAAEEYLGKSFPDHSGGAYLLLRLDGASREALDQKLDPLTELLTSLGALDVFLADTQERKSAIWDARGAFLEAIKGGTPSMDECDVVVPRLKIAAFVSAAKRIGEEKGVRVRSFGHAGDGNLHIYACKDALSDAEWEKRRRQVMDALYTLSRGLSGQVSGEHGIGHAKAGYLKKSLGEEQLTLMKGIKAVFDPSGILNPGKVVL